VSGFERLLVAVDGYPEGQRALEYALELAAALPARLHAVAVEGRLPRYPATVAEVDEAKRDKDEFFETIARLASEQAAEKGIELDVELAAGPPADAIIRVARRDHDDLIIVGYRRRLFGSTADRLCRNAPCPVLIVRGSSGQPLGEGAVEGALS
jgi:nucleotide-binding universal stress UspA family protein